MKMNCLRVLAVIAMALALSFASQAHAGWGWHSGGGSWGGSWGGGSWGGSYGSYGGSWGGSYGSYGGSWGGRYGSYGGSYGSGGSLGWRGHRGSYGGGSWGSYGSYGGSRGGYSYSAPVTYSYAGYYAPVQAAVVVDDGCGVTTQSYGGTVVGESYGGEVVYPTESYETYPATEQYSAPATEMPSEPMPPPSGNDGAAVGDDKSALITVDVPQDAIVYVNGYRTKSTGAHRRFMSAGLERGATYAFEVRAEVDRDGKAVRRTKVVTLAGGQRRNVAFGSFDAEAPSVTTVKLHVPEDAVVTLAGQETQVKGSTRVFATRRLAAGESWDNYQVHVSVVRDGREIVRQRDMTIRSGEVYELSFLVDDASLAAN